MEDAYFASVGPEEQKRHAALALRAKGSSGVAADAHIRPDLNAAEVVIVAPDRRGLFADLASALSGLGANVVGARVYTSRDGQALDIFYVQDIAGAPFGCDSPRLIERLAHAMEAAGRGEPLGGEPRKPMDLGRTAAFAIAPSVAIDNETSEDATVVEASGRDRPGLLEALARTLSEAGLSIQSAHIDNYGERAVDAFYVVDAKGEKVTDARRRNAVRHAVLTALAESDTEPAGGRRASLQRARASVAR